METLLDQATWVQLKLQAFDWSGRILSALAILFIGLWVTRKLSGLTKRTLGRKEWDPIITSFLANIVFVALMAFVIVAVLGRLGVETASFAALIAAAGLAIGLALQGSLANFASGFMLIVLRPFKKGDYIEGAGTAGIIDEMQVFHTVLKTPDNKLVIIPNAKLTNDNITNFTAMETRRIDLKVGVSYSDDLSKVKAVLRRIVDSDPRILRDPAPEVVVAELADSSVNLIARVWVKSGDYWAVVFDNTEKIKTTFDAEGITIPFPQRHVHVIQK
jgi:small conductance mechanosensitive channel